MSHENNVQVKEGYYARREYNTLERFISYFYQINSVTRLDNIQSVLEIGPGSKLVSNELSRLGYDVTTCDFDVSINPDIVCDVRDLPKNKKYDVIMACQILEHIPYEAFEKVMDDFYEISNKYVVVSLPRRSTGFNIVMKIPFIQTLFKRKFFDISMQLPLRFPGFKESGQHYWEIDGWTTGLKKVRKSLKSRFTIHTEFSPPLYKYHRFFILEKK
jgi:hypothetical protein